MRRRGTFIDFSAMVAERMRRGEPFKPEKPLPKASVIANGVVYQVQVKLTDHGNTSFICPNKTCSRKNIFPVVADEMRCKFCGA